MKENTGYIAVEFDDTQKQKIIRWSSQIPERDIARAVIEGKDEGGNVTGKLHLTLFYGLDEDSLNQDELNDFIARLDISSVDVIDVGIFPVEEFDCNALYLEVSDESGELKSAHERLEAFPYFPKYQKPDFRPHITLAYVGKDFDTNSLTDDFPRNLLVKAITHFRKTASIS